MKNYFFVVFALLVFGGVSNAQVLLEENFDYTAGSALLGQGGWTITGTSTINPFTVGSPGLSYVGYLSSGIGNALPIANTGQDAYVNITPQTSGTIYASLLVNFSATNFGGVANSAYAGDYFFHLTQGLITSNAFYPRVFVRSADNGNIAFGISKSSVSSAPYRPTFGDSIYSLNTTYLVVAKYKFNTGTTTDDEVSLFVFNAPDLPTVEPVTPNVGPVTSNQTDATDLSIVNIRQGTATSAPTGTIDGIRVSTLWSDISVPVELTSFSANNVNGNVELLWKTATEKNNNGFEVERKSANSEFVKIGFVKGNGTTTNLSSYSFTDKNVNANYSYRLKQIDFDGTFTYSNIVNVSAGQSPSTFALGQNFPNPFNPSTTISYSLPQAGVVTLAIFNTLGEKVKEVVNSFQEAGNYTVSLNASDLSSGNYIYNVSVNGQSVSKKMLLIK